ncbi:MAG: hypothetical protein WDO24_11175 [Pseudomonadota bacterium]
MSRFEWLIVIALLAIASAVTLSHLDGTALGRWLSGAPLPDTAYVADDRVFYAIPLLALLIWWASRLFPNAHDFPAHRRLRADRNRHAVCALSPRRLGRARANRLTFSRVLRQTEGVGLAISSQSTGDDGVRRG